MNKNKYVKPNAKVVKINYDCLLFSNSKIIEIPAGSKEANGIFENLDDYEEE